MGQCMSRKAAGAFAASAAVSHNRPTKMHKHQQLKSPDDDNNRKSPGAEIGTAAATKRPACTKGVAMSFGFKRRPGAPVAANAAAARRLAASDGRDRNGNEEGHASETTPLTSSVAAPGRSTPRLPAPKREPMTTAPARGARFGFRGAPNSRFAKVADLNAQTAELGYSVNNNMKRSIPLVSRGNVMTATDNNRNTAGRMKVTVPAAQVGKYTLQSTHLPKPEPIRVIETKTAKTLANNNRRTAGMYQQHHHEETSSKDGSLTEDSGVGSHLSGYGGKFCDNEGVPELERLDGSPTFGARRNSQHKPRNLELVVTGNNKFDVRELDDSNDSTESCPPPPLPQLPSAFNIADNRRSPYQANTGIVRERTIEYHRSLNWDNRGRKISITSSEGFSDDYGEEEKTLKDRFRSEKTFIKSTTNKTFLKTRAAEVREAESSPPSSDEHEWVHGGEAMADDISVSMSSSDESKDKHFNKEESVSESVPVSAAVIGTALQSLMNSTLNLSSFTSNKEVKNVLLTIEDPKFAAVAAASNSGSLLDDELLSPVESLISCSESEELKKKLPRSSSNSKDVNDKLTPPSPGTPTHASNSLSLSDGKDDFLIDDEIADQPALVFEDTLTNTDAFNDTFTVSQNNSENTPTVVDSTPKPKRRVVHAFEGSPLSVRNKKLLSSRTGSLDTLSPCESIASDDLMMDYDFSQSSGLEDCDKQSYPSLNDAVLSRSDAEYQKVPKEWPHISRSGDRFLKSSARTRLLSQRASVGSPSPGPDSPRSLDGGRRGALHAGSPARCRPSPLRGYDSDEGGVRLDRAHHQAIKQDVMGIKAMLLKLRRLLNEQKEDLLLRSETHNPFECQATLTNGLFNSLSSAPDVAHSSEENMNEARLELADLRRQVLFLQGQLEDKEKTVQNLQEQMVKLLNDDYHPKSAPASTTASDIQNMCNAATQTERIRPISAGPSLLNGSTLEGSSGSLVSANSGRSRQPVDPAKRGPPKLWRQPGEPPSPPRYAANASAISRRARSSHRAARAADPPQIDGRGGRPGETR